MPVANKRALSDRPCIRCKGPKFADRILYCVKCQSNIDSIISPSVKRVMVGKYTYETDLDLCIGDTVLLPTPDFLKDVKGPTWEGQVSSLQSSYTGPCARILRKL